MIYLDNPSTDPAYNLALEEYLVKYDCRDIAMLWQDRPAVIVGRNQHTDNQVDRAYAASHDIAVVRRLSGGGAVYHDAGNLNFTLIRRDAQRLKKDCDFFTRPVLQVLRSYGLDARFSGRNDLVVDGRKFSGNAQYYHGSTVLHHGTILWDSDLSVLARVLKPKTRIQARGVDSHESRVTNLAPYLGGEVSLDRFKQDLRTSLMRQSVEAQAMCDADRRVSELPDVMAALVEKYRSDEWNWGAGPPPECDGEQTSFPASC